MPEFRKDPIVQRWVVVAPDRANRPLPIPEIVDVEVASFDPFAEGNEAATPPESFAFRAPDSMADGPGWRVRVIPNKFPALQIPGELEHHSQGIYERMNGLGTHDVIVECPHNETSLSRLSVENIREIFRACQARMLEIKKDPRLVYALIFKNKGTLAGTRSDILIPRSSPHPLSQLQSTKNCKGLSRSSGTTVVPFLTRSFFKNVPMVHGLSSIQNDSWRFVRTPVDFPSKHGFCQNTSKVTSNQYCNPISKNSVTSLRPSYVRSKSRSTILPITT